MVWPRKTCTTTSARRIRRTSPTRSRSRATFVRDAMATIIDVKGPHAEVIENLNMPPSFVILDRVVWGVSAILGKLEVTAPWRAMLLEYRDDGPPGDTAGRCRNGRGGVGTSRLIAVHVDRERNPATTVRQESAIETRGGDLFAERQRGQRGRSAASREHRSRHGIAASSRGRSTSRSRHAVSATTSGPR